MPTLAKNKKGLFNYTVLEEFEAGIVLTGAEVKSVKAGRLSLVGSFVTINKKNDAWIKGLQINAYPPAVKTQTKYDPIRDRKLLLHDKEITHMQSTIRSGQGLTIIPTLVYTKGSLIKVKVAIARGKRRIDKRETIKKRETDRKIRQAMKRR
ncbi:MAG: SsrA-binding protein [Candidatus Buchananbacteria bacterium CG10_big_fil_rev_8_21_14_0_10_42_9]|uniref:SsrA-binding protein n=1 Tax=Candidatus Buchananbacteria bacterium CG10_big_fil_rev_8_21_14_0_10_42_9 TaxID=1974526 RepID=A0A2H0W2I1_9BACT|nr:MAG: SsrA-binding protein [Candidatus Buchananbacteria bacterium CG10_big_fil_rev_8_21_14_0_10_42_9]